jgi:catechol 2,3-dioxygenase-like lactoylglutathione lyase family enzyme
MAVERSSVDEEGVSCRNAAITRSNWTVSVAQSSFAPVGARLGGQVRRMTTGVTLDHCVVHVTDWERSNAFYRDVLGAEVVPMGSGWAYRFGMTQLNLHGPGVDPHPVARLPVPRMGARGAGTSVYFRDPDGSLLEFISYIDAERAET